MVDNLKMDETDTRPWSELLPHLAKNISNKLDLIELLAFRGTCRNWLRASSNASANLKETLLHQVPWLLCQESCNKQECVMHDFTTKTEYKLNIPDLIGTNFLGSFQGWLLLFNSRLGGRIFFFCPLSLDTLYLPNLPRSQICSNSMAACSSSPTSIEDRTICVIMQDDIWLLVVYVLRPWSETWNKVSHYCNFYDIGYVSAALQEDDNLILFSYKDMNTILMINIENRTSEVIIELKIHLILNEVIANYYSSNQRKLLRRTCEAMGNSLKADDIVKESFSMDDLACAYFCGTGWHDSNDKELMLFNESFIDKFHHHDLMLFNEFNNEEFYVKKFMEPRAKLDFMHLKRGVWIHPRLFRL